MTPFTPFAHLRQARQTPGMLGQAPATEATQQRGFSTIEKVLIISTTISALSFATHLYELHQHARRQDNPMPRGATLKKEGSEWVLRFREGGSRRFATKKDARAYLGGLAPA